MSYKLITSSLFEEELRQQALDYQDQFSTGISDFLDAIEDTYHRLLARPFGYPVIEELNDPSVRGIHVKASSKRKNYAKDFPFKLIYKIYQERMEIVVYQLWPEKSNRRIDELE